MRKRIFLLITFVVVVAILLLTGNAIKNNAKHNVFRAEKINIEKDFDKNTKNSISRLYKDNGVFLLNSVESNVSYLILDGTHLDLNNEAPYYSDVKVEAKDDLISIYFREEVKKYPLDKYPEQKLVYKIMKDKNYEYIKVFKNGKASYFDSVGGY